MSGRNPQAAAADCVDARVQAGFRNTGFDICVFWLPKCLNISKRFLLSTSFTLKLCLPALVRGSLKSLFRIDFSAPGFFLTRGFKCLSLTGDVHRETSVHEGKWWEAAASFNHLASPVCFQRFTHKKKEVYSGFKMEGSGRTLAYLLNGTQQKLWTTFLFQSFVIFPSV